MRTRFVEVLQNYQNVEREYRQKYRQRIERQFRIGEPFEWVQHVHTIHFASLVNPNASPAEIDAVVNDPEGGSQIFSQAVCDTVAALRGLRH